ncbi:thymidine phosphorylase [Mugil cephalus]|uniref:thymidine phosphorylase n=1 Tax=Mugil cephalus TaxID=48193 RepID=UPI001FB5CEDA|nr:thymidine phosphorylase [Mugil cephalus]
MSSMQDLIRKKRDGGQFSHEDIKALIQAVTSEPRQDCQIGAMLMAIWMKGMVVTETQSLTKEMMLSGEVLSWPEEWRKLVVDKHSTGGVGDKVSLVLAPALAACGCKVPMISGRGLAHTGGTLDKLESIPGYKVQQSREQILNIVGSVGCCIVGQTETLVPADRVLYALRDVTSTVDSVPLITGSIISKKGAESLSALVLDVKFGRAALYKDLDGAKELAKLMVDTGNGLGIKTAAALSRMDGTIGRCVGNSLEVIESLETLKGKGPDDLMELVMSLGGVLLMMVGLVPDQSEGSKRISEAVNGGAALKKFQEMMEAQGVAKETARALCSAHCDYFSVLRKSEFQQELTAPTDGVVADIDGMALAEVLHKLLRGASFAGSPWVRIHYETPPLTPDLTSRLQSALKVQKDDGTQTQHGPKLVAEVLLPDQL